MTDIAWNYTIYITRSKAMKDQSISAAPGLSSLPSVPTIGGILGFGTGDIAQRQ